MILISPNAMPNPFVNIHMDVESRNDSYQWLRTQERCSIESQTRFIEGQINHRSQDRYWYLYDNMKDKYVGLCGLTSVISGQSAEFSLLIYTHERKQGYGRKGLTLLLDSVFDQQTYGPNMIKYIYGETYVYETTNSQGLEWAHDDKVYFINPAWKIFESLGFEIEGFLKYRNQKTISSQREAVHSLAFGITGEKWISSQGSLDA